MSSLSRSTHRRLLRLLVVFLVVVAGCGDDDTADGDTVNDGDAAESASPSIEPTAQPTEEASSPATPTEEVVLTGSFRGVTADAIKLGVVYMDLEAVRALTDLDYGDFEATYGAIIDEVNASGGVLGRRIEPAFAPYVPVGDASMEEGCVRLTEDEQVFAAAGPLLFDGPLCYTELYETAFVGPGQNRERMARSDAPWFATVTNLDDAAESAVRGFAEQGLYDGATVAVVGVGTDESQLTDVVLPALEELGVNVAGHAIITTPLGDTDSSDAEVAIIAERFRADGVDTVIALANGSLQWVAGLTDTGYRPTNAFIDLQGVRAYLGTANERELEVFEGSVAGAHNQWHRWLDDPLIQECVGVVERATDITIIDPVTAGPDDPDNIVSLQWACADIGLFVAVAEAAGPDLTYDSFRQAGEQLGAFAIPGFGPGFYGPDSPDGDPPIYYWTWDADAGIHVTDGTAFD